MIEKLDYNRYNSLRDKYNILVNRLANVRMIMFVIMVLSFIVKYYYYLILFNVVFIVSLVSFIILVLVHHKYFKIYDYYDKYVLVLDEYIARDNGKWKEFQDNGIDFLDDKKSYFRDLDIVGDCSLFQYLSVCKTLGGRKKLIDRLSNLESNEKDLYQNQKLIEELANNVDFVIKFQVAMNYYNGKKIHLSEQLKLFYGINDKGFDFFIGLVASIICISLFILGFFNVISFSYFYAMFLFNVAISFLYFYIYREDFSGLDKITSYYGKLSNVFELVANYNGTSFKMKKYVKDMKNGLTAIYQLKKLDGINSLRSNILSNFLLNGLCCLNLFVRVKYVLFLNSSFTLLENIVSNIEDLEAMISLANIGILKKNKCMPIFTEKVSLKFETLKHPLIDEYICVSNSFDGSDGVNIITGSNMGGKTTFIRTIGINLLLMQAGTYVCGEYMEASYFKLFTSMRVMDNMEKGISTFYGELLRIKDMVDYVNKGNMLVLIDEIFKGTNYEDRMYGAKEVVRKLNNKKILAFITTHDFELCDSDNVKNYHVKEEYEGDKIIFDYKVRNGKCVSTNAKYLMKKLDIVN